MHSGLEDGSVHCTASIISTDCAADTAVLRLLRCCSIDNKEALQRLINDPPAELASTQLVPSILASDQQAAFNAWQTPTSAMQLLRGPSASGKTSAITPIALNAVASRTRLLYVAPTAADCAGFEKQLHKAGLASFCVRLNDPMLIETLAQRHARCCCCYCWCCLVLLLPCCCCCCFYCRCCLVLPGAAWCWCFFCYCCCCFYPVAGAASSVAGAASSGAAASSVAAASTLLLLLLPLVTLVLSGADGDCLLQLSREVIRELSVRQCRPSCA